MLCKAVVLSLFLGQYFLLAVDGKQKRLTIGLTKRNAFANYKCQPRPNGPDSGGAPSSGGSSIGITGSGSGVNGTSTGNSTSGGGSYGGANYGGGSQGSDLSLKLKKGFAFVSASELSAFGDKISWSYNWSPTSNGQIPSNVQYFPQMYGTKISTSDWTKDADSSVQNGAKALLGFNEPDYTGEANLDVDSATALWKQTMEPYHGKAKLISPAVTNGGAPMGIDWLSRFIKACTGCHIDYAALHWYTPIDSSDSFEGYFTQANQTLFPLKIFVTEFRATSGSDDQEKTFYQRVIPWLDQQDFIVAYTATGEPPNKPFVDGGQLTYLGQVYADA